MKKIYTAESMLLDFSRALIINIDGVIQSSNNDIYQEIK